MSAPRLYDPAPGPDLRIADLIGAYLSFKDAQVKAGLLEASGIVNAHLYCAAFIADFGTQPVMACRRGDLKRFLVLHPEYRSPHTKHGATGAVVTAFRWAVEDGLIAVCPYARPRDLPVPQPRLPIRRDEIRLMLANARDDGYTKTCVRFRIGLWFLWETGIRTCELYRLEWKHYDPERGVFELHGKSTNRTGRKRLIVLSKRAWRLIRFLRRWAPMGQTYVFQNGRGGQWSRWTFGKLFRKHARHAGVREEVSAYCARHGFCCEMLEAGAGERQIADLLGQSSTRYVSWYGRGVKSKVDYLRDTAEMRDRKRPK